MHCAATSKKKRLPPSLGHHLQPPWLQSMVAGNQHPTRTRRVAQTRWESVAEIDDEGNITHSNDHLYETSAAPFSISPAKAAVTRGTAVGSNANAKARARRLRKRLSERESQPIKTGTQPPNSPNNQPTHPNLTTLPESVDLTLSPSTLPESDADEARLRMPPPHLPSTLQP